MTAAAADWLVVTRDTATHEIFAVARASDVAEGAR